MNNKYKMGSKNFRFSCGAIKIKIRRIIMSRYTVVSIVTRLRAERSGVRIPAKINFSIPLIAYNESAANPASCSMGTGFLSRGLKRPRRDVDHSLPSNTEVKNEKSYTSSAPTCLHGVDRKNFSFAFT